jgi:EpsI family protein
MAETRRKRRFLESRHTRILSAVLILQAVLFYALSHGEAVPIFRPLGEFPTQVGEWNMTSEGVIEKEILDVLRADDTLNRIYEHKGDGAPANLFVAYFKTQRTGQAPHSPKNCLPGAGWVPSSSGVIPIAVPGETEPIQVNRYTVSRGASKSVVLYWYQTRNRVIASEYMAKICLVLDAIRYNRTDTALVRVVVPVGEGSEEQATEAAVDFVRSFFNPLRQHLPS